MTHSDLFSRLPTLYTSSTTTTAQTMDPSSPSLQTQVKQCTYESLTTAELRQEIKGLKAGIDEEAERILLESLPNKVVLLDALFKETREGRLKAVYKVEPFPSPGNLPRDAPVPVNQAICNVIDNVKKHICDMINDLSTLRLWLKLNMPKMEDGNNFGVEVQEEVQQMLNRGRISGLSVLQVISKYYSRRGKFLSDMRKYDDVEDFVTAARDLDEKQYIHLVQSICDLRNNYALLYDKITKNKEKLIKPRGSSSTLQYY